jgi:hypothetical protein
LGELVWLDWLVGWAFEALLIYLRLLQSQDWGWVQVMALPIGLWLVIFVVFMLLWRWRIWAFGLAAIGLLSALLFLPFFLATPQVIVLDGRRGLDLLSFDGKKVEYWTTRRENFTKPEIMQTIGSQGWGLFPVHFMHLKACKGEITTALGSVNLIEARLGLGGGQKVCGLSWLRDPQTLVFWVAQASVRDGLAAWQRRFYQQEEAYFLTGCSGMLRFSMGEDDKIAIQHWRIDQSEAWHFSCKNYLISNFIGTEKVY